MIVTWVTRISDAPLEPPTAKARDLVSLVEYCVGAPDWLYGLLWPNKEDGGEYRFVMINKEGTLWDYVGSLVGKLIARIFIWDNIGQNRDPKSWCELRRYWFGFLLVWGWFGMARTRQDLMEALWEDCTLSGWPTFVRWSQRGERVDKVGQWWGTFTEIEGVWLIWNK